MIEMTGQSGQDILERSARAGKSGQDGKLGQDSLDRIARTG
jgi:hypothetical protein